MGRAGWGASLNEDKGSSGTQNSVQQLLHSLSIPGDNEPTIETLSMMNVDKDREARRSITERLPTHMFTSGPSPPDERLSCAHGDEARTTESTTESTTDVTRCALFVTSGPSPPDDAQALGVMRPRVPVTKAACKALTLTAACLHARGHNRDTNVYRRS